MSDWENEDTDIPAVTIPVVNPSQWDDEDASDGDVKDAWDASESESEKKNPPTGQSPVVSKPKQKKTLQQKIQERKEAEERKRMEALKKMKGEEGDGEETPEERKARLEKAVREADLENAKDLFGVGEVAVVPAKESFLETMRPKGRDEFVKFSQLLVAKLAVHEKSPGYPSFVETLARDLSLSLSVEDIKKVSSTLTILANEKQKALKPAANKKKGALKSVKTISKGGDLDTTNYDDVYNELDDFM
ncbi:Eukaryotic translation initiation factor 3 subunit J [Chytridiales sp. JEL 0842]|nr:Eukaryotic translation initiation factor 3 subunit J [Chytridiales sp. JEL 0842]